MSTAYALLLSGHDTIECAYYLAALPGCTLDYEKLAVEKEALRLAKVRRPKAIQLGSEEFLLMPNGTKSGYPISKATWWNGIKAGRYPAGVKLSPHTTAWRASDIKALIEAAK